AQEAELRSILGLSVPELAELSKACLRRGLLVRGSEGLSGESFSSTYEVSSQALALDIIDRMDPERRQRLHDKIAQGLLRVDKIPLEEIAYHLAKGGQAEMAARYYQDAGMALKDQGQISSALKCLGKSIQLLPDGSTPWREMVAEAAQLSVLSGNYSEAEK